MDMERRRRCGGVSHTRPDCDGGLPARTRRAASGARRYMAALGALVWLSFLDARGAANPAQPPTASILRGYSSLVRLRGGAEIGKGDPRWIVKEREDGKNVGSWHWEEKDMFPWARQRLQSLNGIAGKMESFEGGFKGAYMVQNISRISGDVVIHLRKGKLWALCDLEIVAVVKGTVSKGDGKPVEVTGEVEFVDVSVDGMDELEIRTSVQGSGPEVDAFRRWLKVEGYKSVENGVISFLKDLQSQTDAGQQSISKALSDVAVKDLEKAKQEAAKMAQVNKVVLPDKLDTDVAEASKPTGVVRLEEEFEAHARDIFDCFTVANKVAAYTRCSDTLIETRPGGRFSMFSVRTGQITGGFEELHEPEFIKCKWRMQDWAEGHFSSLKILLHEMGGGQGCKLELSQEGIPANKVAEVERQWRQRFFAQIKIGFGYGNVAGAHHQMFGGM